MGAVVGILLGHLDLDIAVPAHALRSDGALVVDFLALLELAPADVRQLRLVLDVVRQLLALVGRNRSRREPASIRALLQAQRRLAVFELCDPQPNIEPFLELVDDLALVVAGDEFPQELVILRMFQPADGGAHQLHAVLRDVALRGLALRLVAEGALERGEEIVP
nr:MAG TPA_asm: hypothetical protein [Caudoviricetes sp.]